MSTPPTTVILARHAVTADTGQVLYGRSPGQHLSEEGTRQAKDLARLLSPLRLSAIYASPLERTTETAQVVATERGLTVREVPDLQEADYGEWTGRRLEELRDSEVWRAVVEEPSTVHFPGGESIGGMQARAVRAVGRLVERHEGETVLVVSHADVIKAVLAHFMGLPLDRFQRLVVSPASVSILAFFEGRAWVLRLNERGGLDDLIQEREGDD